jgi:hypothetical protein
VQRLQCIHTHTHTHTHTRTHTHTHTHTHTRERDLCTDCANAHKDISLAQVRGAQAVKEEHVIGVFTFSNFLSFSCHTMFFAQRWCVPKLKQCCTSTCTRPSQVKSSSHSSVGATMVVKCQVVTAVWV